MHDLEIKADGTASMFYTKEDGTPWHGLGHGVDGLLTASEAISASGLDWEVEKRPLWIPTSNGNIQVPNRYGIVRTSDEKVFPCAVGSDYTPIQNKEAFDFFDTLVDSGEAKYTTAGALAGGQRVWLTAKIGGEASDVEIAGEAYDVYLLISNAHNGARALTAVTTFIRVVCANTETMALAGAKTRWTLAHRGTMEGKIDEARKALGITFKATDAFTAEVEKLLAIEVTKDAFNELVTAKGFLPEQKRQKDKNVAQLMNIFETEPSLVDSNIAGTAWGAYNALTFWLDHGREVRSAEGRMTSLIDGFGARLRGKAHERLLALA